MRNLHIILILATFISGCATLTAEPTWPTDLPEKAYFVQAYESQLKTDQSGTKLNNYLYWIKRFYTGTIIYPNGWNEVSRQLIESLSTYKDKQSAKQRLFELGKIISLEWAKPNEVRRINSANMGVWGNSLRISAERAQQLAFIGQVEQDVRALLDGKLNSSEITNQRYYPVDEHDNF